MRCEIPVLLRCCFCFPLRLGLLGWAYLKEIFNLFFVTDLIMKTYNSYHISHAGVIIFSLIILFIISDIVLHAFFIFSAHKKDYRKIRIFYRYSVFALCLYVLIIVLIIATWTFYTYMRPILPILIPSIITYFLLICFQGYLIILVRSEFIKLKNHSQFEFVNHAADQKNMDYVKEISKKEIV